MAKKTYELKLLDLVKEKRYEIEDCITDAQNAAIHNIGNEYIVMIDRDNGNVMVGGDVISTPPGHWVVLKRFYHDREFDHDSMDYEFTVEDVLSRSFGDNVPEGLIPVPDEDDWEHDVDKPYFGYSPYEVWGLIMEKYPENGDRFEEDYQYIKADDWMEDYMPSYEYNSIVSELEELALYANNYC